MLKAILIGLVGVLPVSALAQSPAAEPTPAFSAGGGFFALSVEDIDASIQWYREKLGLKVTTRATLNGVSIALLEGGGLVVELFDREDAVPLRSVAPATVDNINRVHGYVKAGVIVNDWDALIRAFRERRVDIVMGPFPTRPNKRANLAIKDNSGNLIQFFGP